MDTGFIVMNDKTYPLFTRFLDRLDVARAATDMSFSYWCRASGMQYGSSSFNSLMAQRRNLVSPGFWKFLLEINRFFKLARRELKAGALDDISLDDFMTRYRFSNRFRDEYLLPMSAAIWSASDDDMARFPMAAFARFYENHGLLSATEHPQWYFIDGGSHTYVQAFLDQFPGTVHTGAGVRAVQQEENGITVLCDDGRAESFDKVIIAAHADETLKMLTDPTPEERRLLSHWRYSTNTVVLHTDTRFLPPNKGARASWNTVRDIDHTGRAPITVTYDMTRLQRLNTRNTYCVTLNPHTPVREDRHIQALTYTHPIFDFDSMATQPELAELNTKGDILFCGAYFGYGFHEDGVRSGVEAARHLGGDF